MQSLVIIISLCIKTVGPTLQYIGRIWVYCVSPFGSARACRDYRNGWTMNEVYIPLRLHGMLLILSLTMLFCLLDQEGNV